MDVEAIEVSLVDEILNDCRQRNLFKLVGSCMGLRFSMDNTDKRFVCWLMNFLKDQEYFLIVDDVDGRVLRRVARNRNTGELIYL